MRKPWILLSPGLVRAAGIFALAYEAGVEPLPASYQVDGIVQYRNDLGSAWQARFRPRDYALLC